MLDADGNEITDETHIGNLNPFRYRGYYYDTETELYYLKSRYYDPKIGRFITIDDHSYLDPDTINGVNLYAYCGNNPVMRVDPEGAFALTTFLLTVGVSALFGAIDGGITAAMSGDDFWKGFAAGAIGGAVGGLITGFVGGFMPVPPALSVLARGISSAVYNVTNKIFQSGSFSKDNLGLYAADVLMDMTYSMLYVGHFGKIGGNLGNLLNGLTDSTIDILQTYLFFSPQAQQRIRG